MTALNVTALNATTANANVTTFGAAADTNDPGVMPLLIIAVWLILTGLSCCCLNFFCERYERRRRPENYRMETVISPSGPTIKTVRV